MREGGNKMRIVVDEMPKEPKECLFSADHHRNGNIVCQFDVLTPCNPQECPYLKREHSSIEFDIK